MIPLRLPFPSLCSVSSFLPSIPRRQDECSSSGMGRRIFLCSSQPTADADLEGIVSHTRFRATELYGLSVQKADGTSDHCHSRMLTAIPRPTHRTPSALAFRGHLHDHGFFSRIHIILHKCTVTHSLFMMRAPILRFRLFLCRPSWSRRGRAHGRHGPAGYQARRRTAETAHGGENGGSASLACSAKFSQVCDHGFGFPSPNRDGPRPIHSIRNFYVQRADRTKNHHSCHRDELSRLGVTGPTHTETPSSLRSPTTTSLT